jgi:SAM-dependent methyltransferase
MPSISADAEKASGIDYPSLLNKIATAIVAEIVLNSVRPARIIEFGTGSGKSIDALRGAVLAGGGLSAWREVRLTLVEPSLELLRVTSRRLRSLGIQHLALPVFAHEVPGFDQGGYDIVFGVASNHYPDPSISFRAARQLLLPGGFLVIGEWCHAVTEYPSRFRRILERLEYVGLRDDLDAFDNVFVLSTGGPPPQEEPRSQMANEQYIEFYSKHLSRGIPYLTHCLKGHCPLSKNLERLERVGFDLHSADIERLLDGLAQGGNPIALLPDSDLLACIVAQKPRSQVA